MNSLRHGNRLLLVSLFASACLTAFANAQDGSEVAVCDETLACTSVSWQQQAVQYADRMSRVQWTPVAEGMPRQRRGDFRQGSTYTGVPYSNQTYDGQTIGRSIGFEIYLKTFLAAVQNPKSVLYTERVPVSEDAAKPYYGMVCSSFTSYALQCGLQFVARQHVPHGGVVSGPERSGVQPVQPQSAQAAEVGDIIYTPPTGQHVEIVTEITRDDQGEVTHVRVIDSAPPTTRIRNHTAADFETHISSRGRGLYRITDLDQWRQDNRAETFLFPNYVEDMNEAAINRVLLLDHGDWVPYFRDQPVKINVMDRDSQGVRRLVIRRGDEVVEDMELSDLGVVERRFSTCGDYTAYCVMEDGSLSQACEFAVCDLDFQLSAKEVTTDQPWHLEFTACHMTPIYVYLSSAANPYGRYHVLISDRDREMGRVTIPAGLLQPEDLGVVRVRLFGENPYGRLHRQETIQVVDR